MGGDIKNEATLEIVACRKFIYSNAQAKRRNHTRKQSHQPDKHDLRHHANERMILLRKRAGLSGKVRY